MPSFKFRGFTTGSLVAITVAQGAASASAQTTWGQALTPNATFSIQLVDGCTDVVAPYGAFFRATGFTGFNVSEPAGDTNVYDPTQHRITLIWDFDDPGYGFAKVPNIPTAWRNLNVAYGKEVAHVWHTPGSYTVTCFAFDMAGNWGTASYTFGSGGQSPAIADPNTFPAFAGANTIVWSQAGDFTGKPTGATECTTIAQVHDVLRAQMNANNRSLRVLMRAGETFPDNWFFSLGDNSVGGTGCGYPIALGASASVSFNYRDGMKGIHFGRFGTGARPAIRYTANQTKPPIGFPDRTDCRQLVLSDLDFGAGWNAAEEAGRAGWSGEIGAARGFIMFTRCKWDGFDAAAANRQQIERGLIYHDSEITNWANYGMFCDTVRTALLGCDVYQRPDALTGVSQLPRQENWTFGNRHGPFRSGNRNYETVLSCTSFFSIGGWSDAGNNWQTIQPTADQPCVRIRSHFDGAGVNARRHYHVIERCSFEGGWGNLMGIGVDNPDAGAIEKNAKNTLIDMCLFVGTANNAEGKLAIMESGVTLRNSYFYQHAIAQRATNKVQFEINVICFTLNSALVEGTDYGPVEIYNNTLINRQPLADLNVETNTFFLTLPYVPIKLQKGRWRQSGSGTPPLLMENVPIPANYLRQENNVIRIVNATTASPGNFSNPQFEPLSTANLDGFTCRYAGPRWNFRYLSANPIGNFRRGGAGSVAPGEWVDIPWPNSNPADNNGNAPNGAAAFRTAVLGSVLKRHRVSVSGNSANTPKGMADPALWTGGPNGVTFDFSSGSVCSVQNNSGVTWPSTEDLRILFDLAHILMGPISSVASPAAIPLSAPLAGSSAILSARPNGVPWPLTGFLTDYRLDSRTPPAGTIVTSGAHKAGAIA